MVGLVPRLLLVVLLASSVGCTAWGKSKPKGKPADGCCLNNPQVTSFQTVINTSASPSTDEPERFEVIRSQDRLDIVWPELFAPNTPPSFTPPIDFDSEMVIVYSMGTQPSGCYSAEIEAVHAQGEALLVEVIEKEPAPSCVCTFSLVKPFHVIRLDGRKGPASLCVRRTQLQC